MIEETTFNNIEEVNAEKKNRMVVWRPIHTDLVDGKYIVTFVNGDDDPINSQESEDMKIAFNRKKELNDKLQDDSMTFEEMKEYQRLS